ncbi:ATP-binding protein [Algoriphagus persicinus]|uniref:ATP-binding protein n=1 Tax=Algoriphagus persicinus TaxID=3108754 RepID=UPI002B3A649B|nr:ATP-binding protein [Algoriphagus sp. E1-3-M2]MEB2785255.1 ATP-binding protein [Algoriphagus sp. E1-3-M2]
MGLNLSTSFKLLVGILLGALIVGEVLLGILAHKAKNKTEVTFVLLKHSYQVVEQLDAISLQFKEGWLENFPGQSQGIFMDPDRTHSASDEIQGRITKVKTLSADNPAQMAQIGLLEIRLKELSLVTDSIQNQEMTIFYPGYPDESSPRTIVQEVEGLISGMKLREKHLMQIRELENQESKADFTKTFYWLLVGMSLIVFITFIAVKTAFESGVRLHVKMENIAELYKKFFTESPIGMIIVRKRDGLVVDSNLSFSELSNLTIKEIINTPPAFLSDSAGIRQYEDQLSSQITLGKIMAIELMLKPKDRPPIMTSVSIQSIARKDEPCLLVAVQDMSLYKQAQEDMSRALATEIELNNMKTEFITLVSHEFRTPLSTILSSVFLVESYAYPEYPEYLNFLDKHLKRIRSAVNTMTFLVEEFLSLTNIEKNRIDLEFVIVNVKEQIETLLKTFEPFLKGGQYIIYKHEGQPMVYTDPILVSSMITILVSNSVKFSGDNSVIKVSTLVKDGFYIKVKDVGMGIPRQEQSHIFERFFRASNAGNTQGVGLGLHIMKHYVNLLEGEIKIKSTPDFGTEVIIAFKKFLR